MSGYRAGSPEASTEKHRNAFTLRNLWSEVMRLGPAGKVALVERAWRGIGKAIAALFAEAGLGEPQL